MPARTRSCWLALAVCTCAVLATTADAETGVSAHAPSIVFYAGIGEDCCGEDPHAVHGLQAPDGGYIVGGKSIDAAGEWQGFAVKVGPPAPRGNVWLAADEADTYSWSITFGTDGNKDAVNNLAATAQAVFLAGFKSTSDATPHAYLAKHDLSTGALLWEMTIPPAAAGAASAIEVVQITPDGDLVAGGITDAPKDGLEGFKSYGNPFGGTAFLMRLSAAQIQADTAPDAPTWSQTYAGSTTVKGARPVADATGGFIVLTASEDETATLIRTDDQGATLWTQSYPDRGEATDVAVVAVDGVVDGFAFIGHGGDGTTLDGFVTKVHTDGTVAWTKSFGDPIGGVGKFAGLGAGNPALIYDECWGIQATSDGGLVTACGTGIEGCDNWPSGSDISTECQQDPRVDWRGMVTRFAADGALVWQRVDSFSPPDGGEISSSASEYVALTSDGGILSVVDEAFGIGVLVLATDTHQPGPPSSGSSSSSDSGGCGVGSGSSSPSSAAWLWLAVGAMALQRRRRAAQPTR